MRYYIKQGPSPYSQLVNGVLMSYQNIREMDYPDEVLDVVLGRIERLAKVPAADLPRVLPFVRPIIIIIEE